MKKIKAKIIERDIEGEGKVKILRMGFQGDLKVIDEKDDRWIIEGYASVFGNVDSYFEIVDKGAFKDWLDKWPPDAKTGIRRFPKLVLGHNWERPLGPTLEVREDEIGLYVKGELLKEVQDARETYALIKSGATTDLSFGFRVREDEMDHETGYRHLKKIDIFEWSPVLVGANPSAIITGVKSVDGEDISEIPAESIVDTTPEEISEDEPAAEETSAPSEETPAPAAEEEAEVTPEETPGVEDAPVSEDGAPSEDGKAGSALSEKQRDALDETITSLRGFLNTLEALKRATDESESANSETAVGQREQKDSSAKAVKLLIRDARQADKAIEKILFRAKRI